MRIVERLDDGGRGLASALAGGLVALGLPLFAALFVPVARLTRATGGATVSAGGVSERMTVPRVPALPNDLSMPGPSTGARSPLGSGPVAVARRYLGVRYVFGGTDPAVGLDCSGLVQLVFHQL